MANKKLWLGMLVLVLAFGMAVVSCGDDSSGGGTDSALNGIWDGEDGDVMTLGDGNFEISGGGYRVKGTYTTSGNSIAMIITHWGGSIRSGLDPSKWYSKNEIKTQSGGMSDADLNKMFGTITGTYTSTRLTLRYPFPEGAPPETFTKR